MYISGFRFCYNILYYIILTIYIFWFKIHHGKINWENLQTQSILTLNIVNQGTCKFIFIIPNIFRYYINNNLFPLYTIQISKQLCFVFPKHHPKWCNHYKKWGYTVLWDIEKINILNISTHNHHSRHISFTSSSTLTSNTLTILPLSGK